MYFFFKWEENSKKNLLKLIGELSNIQVNPEALFKKYEKDLMGASEV